MALKWRVKVPTVVSQSASPEASLCVAVEPTGEALSMLHSQLAQEQQRLPSMSPPSIEQRVLQKLLWVDLLPCSQSGWPLFGA